MQSQRWQLPASHLAFRVSAALLCLAGFCACFTAYYPGSLSPDSISFYEQAQKLSYVDWYSPVLSLIWTPILFLAPGPQGMLFLLLAFYWGALFILADASIAIDSHAAFAMPLLGVMPFTVNFAGTIWTDVLVAVSWLMCVAVVFHSRIHNRTMSVTTRVVAWSLFLCGSWARPNALFAAVPLAFYLLGPQKARSLAKRAVLTAVFVGGLWVGSQVIFYHILNVQKTHPINSILVFDLAGITHFSGKNVFPLEWSEAETAKIISCYDPAWWDTYNPRGECSFVFRRIDDSGLWDAAGLWRPWFAAVAADPLSYLHHRLAHFLTFMTKRSVYFFHDGNSRAELSQHLRGNIGFAAVRLYVFAAASLGIFRPVFWLALGCLLLVVAPLCSAPSRGLVQALALSSVVYLGTYFFVGVGWDFRYAYWAVLGTSAAAVVLACELNARRKLKVVVSEP